MGGFWGGLYCCFVGGFGAWCVVVCVICVGWLGGLRVLEGLGGCGLF